MGPAPMIRSDLMSVRLATFLLHHADKPVEQITHLMRARAGLGVPLETECGFVGARDALAGAIEQGFMGDANIGRQRGFIDRETVILAGDIHLAGIDILYRVISAVMAEFHLDGPGTRRQAKQLMTEANSKYRQVFRNQFLNGPNRLITGLGVAGAVRQEDAIRL